jgi:hypothetical protein
MQSQFINYVIENNLTLIEAKELIIENNDLYTMRISKLFDYNKELVLELPDDSYFDYYNRIAICFKIKRIREFAYGFEPNHKLTCKNLVSYYIKFHKYK